MSNFKAEMHQIRFPLGLCPTGGTYSASPDPLLYLRRPTSKGRKRKGGGEGKGREREGEGVRRAPISCWHRAPEGLICTDRETIEKHVAVYLKQIGPPTEIRPKTIWVFSTSSSQPLTFDISTSDVYRDNRKTVEEHFDLYWK